MARIAINAQLNPKGAGGVETNLVSMLSALKAGPRDYDISLLSLPQFADDFGEKASFADIVRWPFGQADYMSHQAPVARGLWLRRALGPNAHLFDRAVETYRRMRYGGSPDASLEERDAALVARGVNAVHFPTPQWFETRLPMLYEPWDLQHVHYPEFFTPEEWLLRDQWYRNGCQRAAVIITATQWIKDDIVRQYGISPQKIAVVHRSSLIAQQPMSDTQIAQELAATGLAEPFIFYPAMTFEHKNHIRLFEALAILRDREGLIVPLVLSGRPHKPHLPKIQATIERLGLGGQVRSLGRVSDALLTSLFARARFMIFPSLFEGLGLPVLEAFSHDLPVLAAAETCLPEVIGDAGVLFDARNPEAMAAAIGRAWREPESLKDFPRRGRQRLEVFSWSRGRDALSACYKRALALKLSEQETEAYRLATAS